MSRVVHIVSGYNGLMVKREKVMHFNLRPTPKLNSPLHIEEVINAPKRCIQRVPKSELWNWAEWEPQNLFLKPDRFTIKGRIDCHSTD